MYFQQVQRTQRLRSKLIASKVNSNLRYTAQLRKSVNVQQTRMGAGTTQNDSKTSCTMPYSMERRHRRNFAVSQSLSMQHGQYKQDQVKGNNSNRFDDTASNQLVTNDDEAAIFSKETLSPSPRHNNYYLQLSSNSTSDNELDHERSTSKTQQQPYYPYFVEQLKRQIEMSKRANSHKIASAVDKQKQIRLRMRVINLIQGFKQDSKRLQAQLASLSTLNDHN